MKNLLILAILGGSLFFTACTKTGSSIGSPDASSLAGVGTGGTGTGGVMTAGEWNDLENWIFWKDLLQRDTIKDYPALWGFYTGNRVTVVLKDAGNRLLHDAKISLIQAGETITARTGNDGKAELFPALFQQQQPLGFSLKAEYGGQVFDLGNFAAGTSQVTRSIPVGKTMSHTLDIMFVVDATGSMGDEIFYLKNELLDVINRAGSQLPSTQIRMGSVFYRDNGDEYVTRSFPFSTFASQLLDFVQEQSASGGGDFPEAVDEALRTAVEDQQWSTTAVNRLLFLVLDAPPHKGSVHMQRIITAVRNAQAKGIRIIPISASGIDRETEFLLRFFAISTNGTYVFITDHSGIGNPHHNPTVGNYQVEYLNNLMVRLIGKYGMNLD